MRVCFSCVLLLLSALGIALGQDKDTNFPSGPQYLMTSDLIKNGSSLFLRSISTPSMSFTEPPLEVGASNATGVLIAGCRKSDCRTARSRRFAQDRFVAHLLRRASGQRYRDQFSFRTVRRSVSGQHSRHGSLADDHPSGIARAWLRSHSGGRGGIWQSANPPHQSHLHQCRHRSIAQWQLGKAWSNDLGR